MIELALITVAPHTTALRGNRWKQPSGNRFSKAVRSTSSKSNRSPSPDLNDGWAR
jgi:hypothetical protein